MTGGGGFLRRAGRRITAGTLSAKVTTDGVRKLTGSSPVCSESSRRSAASWPRSTSSSSTAGGTGGVGQGTPTGAAGTARVAPAGHRTQARRRSGGVGRLADAGPRHRRVQLRRRRWSRCCGAASTRASTSSTTASSATSPRALRSRRSTSDTASMYGPELYRGLEGSRYQAVGQYGGSARTSRRPRDRPRVRLDDAPARTRSLQQVGMGVQASGGSMNIAQVAAQTAQFAAPIVSRRAPAMGIMQYRRTAS